WGVVALFQDISERWRFEQLQKDFVANVSHELKAPLSSIKGAGEILLDKVIVEPAKQDEYLKMIVEETDRLEDLVDDILILSELDANTSNYSRAKISVNDLLKKVSRIFRKIMDQENYSLQIILSEENIYIRESEEKLKQVLLNLLENAYKFSAGGSIELGVEYLKNELKFWVKDNGIGIPENELENIWERFYKVDKAHTPGKSGSGLGLSIVKQTIEDSGGRVFVESEYGNGSTFGFYLPLI
ncbi:MAG: sensor histidine kinase, partial [Halanaerobiales bacterium]